MTFNVLIIIPTYNESLTIADTINAIRSYTDSAVNYHIDILVFDSASTDNTAQVVHSLQQSDASLYIVEEAVKSGLGSAYKQAMQYAIDEMNPDCVFEYDADGSHDPRYLLPMIARLEAGADVVVGSRYVKGGGIPQDWAWYRKLLSNVGNRIAQLLLTFKYKDFTSGFRGTKTAYLRKVKLQSLLSDGYGYKLHLFWELHQLGAVIEEYPIQFKDRALGVSKLPSNSIKDSLHVLFTLRYRIHALYIKTCMVGSVGFIFQFVIFNILRLLVVPPLLATLLSVECAIVLNFYNNNRFTFKAHGVAFADKLLFIKKLMHFNLLSVGSIVLQITAVGIWHHFYAANRLEENIALFVGVVFGSMFNYLVYRHWVWRIKK